MNCQWSNQQLVISSDETSSYERTKQLISVVCKSIRETAEITKLAWTEQSQIRVRVLNAKFKQNISNICYYINYLQSVWPFS